MDTGQKEVVIFENPQQKGGQATSQQNTTSSSQDNQSQDENSQNEQDNKTLQQKIAENKKQGITEGAKEAAKQKEQAAEQTPDVLAQQGKNEGLKEATKESIKSKQSAQGKLDSLVEKTQNPLLKLQTTGYLFLNPAPDILTIDPLKVSVRYRSILKAEQVRSVFIKDIADVFVESIPFAAALRIVDTNDKENPMLVKPCKKTDAEKAKSIIMGLIAANKENIDLSSIEVNEDAAKKFEELGKIAPTE